MSYLSTPVSRRTVLGSLAAAALSACTGNSTLGLVGANVKAVLKGRPSGDAYPVTAAQIAALPYATLGFRYGKQPPAVLVLARIEQDDLEWVSSDQVVLVTRGGRIQHSSGLPRDVATSYSYGDDPIARPTEPLSTDPLHLIRSLDLRNPDEIGIDVQTTIVPIGPETLHIVGKARETFKLLERVTVAEWNWKAENFYWIGRDDGRVWRSSQSLSPDTEVMTLELLKPSPRIQTA